MSQSVIQLIHIRSVHTELAWFERVLGFSLFLEGKTDLAYPQVVHIGRNAKLLGEMILLLMLPEGVPLCERHLYCNELNRYDNKCDV